MPRKHHLVLILYPSSYGCMEPVTLLLIHVSYKTYIKFHRLRQELSFVINYLLCKPCLHSQLAMLSYVFLLKMEDILVRFDVDEVPAEREEH